MLGENIIAARNSKNKPIDLALKHEYKNETKQTLLVGRTCIFKQNVDANIEIWRMKSRWKHCVGFQSHPGMQGIQLQYVVLPFSPHLRAVQALATYFNLSILNQIADLAAHIYTEVSLQLFTDFLHNFSIIF